MPNQKLIRTVQELANIDVDDVVILNDDETYTSSSKSHYMLDGCVYDLGKILDFFLENASQMQRLACVDLVTTIDTKNKKMIVSPAMKLKVD
jgi:succinylglutamate desuccinylase